MATETIHATARTQQGMQRAPVFVSIQTSSFSGATLLAFLLGAHPEIATVGEMNGLIARENPDTYTCSCGQPIKTCAFWQAVTEAMHRRGFAFDVADFGTEFTFGGPRPVRYVRRGSFRNNTLDALRDALFLAWPTERRRMDALVARNVAFVESVLEVTGKRVFVDTSKDRMRLGALARASALDVRAVHLVRDVRGVVASRLRRGVPIEAREAARQWTRLHHRIHVALQALPEERRLRVRYEDLCANPQETLARVFHLCGVAPSAQIDDLPNAQQHIVGNAMRLGSLREIRPDDRWRSLLTSQQLRDINRAAQRLSQQFGYGG